MPVIIVAPVRWSRSPLQIFLLSLVLVTGLLIAFGISRNAVTKDMGEPWATAWGIFLSIGAVVSLIGAFWKNKITGMLIERSGILLLGLTSVIWPVATVAVTGLNGLYSSTITMIFAGSCFFQVKYINEHINLILQAINDGGHVLE